MEQQPTATVKFESAGISNGDTLIVEDLNLEIHQGEFVYLTGKVGSGKTSIIRTLTGENPLLCGNARVGDFSLAGLKRKQIPYLRRQTGIIFQDFQLLMDRTVGDNLRFVLRATDWKDRYAIEERIGQTLDLVGLRTKEHKMPHQLSGGEQQRAAIARAILNNPAIILADEPTGNLDEETARSIMDLLTAINRSGTAVLMVTHNHSLMKEYPARTLVLEDGRCFEYEKTV